MLLVLYPHHGDWSIKFFLHDTVTGGKWFHHKMLKEEKKKTSKTKAGLGAKLVALDFYIMKITGVCGTCQEKRKSVREWGVKGMKLGDGRSLPAGNYSSKKAARRDRDCGQSWSGTNSVKKKKDVWCAEHGFPGGEKHAFLWSSSQTLPRTRFISALSNLGWCGNICILFFTSSFLLAPTVFFPCLRSPEPGVVF